jgi:glyoxylase-like metal-dependent hydrolase (beta-lactamase superfamily II)
MRDAVPAAKSIDTLINTHANGDHTYGNQLVKGAQIVASQACLKEMERRPPDAFIKRVENWRDYGESGALIYDLMGRKFDFGGIVNTLPTRTFDRELTLMVGDKRIELINVGPAHTWSMSLRTRLSLPATSSLSAATRLCGQGRSITGLPPATASSAGMWKPWCRAMAL